MKLLQNNRWHKNINSILVAQLTAPKRTAFFWCYLIGTALLLVFLAGCKKENDGIDFSSVYNKKWVSVSQIAEPPWTDPNTGKTYSDLVNFEKDVFPCLRDDYIIFYPDGSTDDFNGAQRCSPDEPEKAPTGTYFYNSLDDSLFFRVPFEVPGLPPSIITIRSKVLKVTNDEILIRFRQELPFTNTMHTITWTYKRIP